MALSTEQQMLIEQRVANDGKSMLVAYLLLIFFGALGIHRFYLGQTKSAVIMLILFVLGWLTAVIYVGFLLLLAVGIWAIVDLFLIPGMIEGAKSNLRDQLGRELAAGGSTQ